MESKTFEKKLAEIQQKLEAPKSQRNNFGNYNYRSAEDILTAVKPLLGDCILTLSDEIVNVGDRFYVKATATISCGSEGKSTTAYAREEEARKGMDGSQITGASSSYARKYALNGLFCIDDTKDADTQDNSDRTGVIQKKMPMTTELDDDAMASKIKYLYAMWHKLGFDTKQKNEELKDRLKIFSLNEITTTQLLTEIKRTEELVKAKEFAEGGKVPF
jgi:hypothetical protein